MKIALSVSVIANLLMLLFLAYYAIDTGISLDHCRTQNLHLKECLEHGGRFDKGRQACSEIFPDSNL